MLSLHAEIVNAGYNDDSEGLSAKFDSKGKDVASPAMANDEELQLVDVTSDTHTSIRTATTDGTTYISPPRRCLVLSCRRLRAAPCSAIRLLP